LIALHQELICSKKSLVPTRQTARDIQKPLEQLELSTVPFWSDHLVDEAFFRVRDERWLDSEGIANFKRRIPWLFIDNGCFLRAALIRRKFEEWGYPQIKKIFCFGSMEFPASWTKNGVMTYRDHVAVILRTSSDCLVIDPPLSFDRPLTFPEWVAALHINGNITDARFSICNALTFGHNSYADETDPSREAGKRNGEMKNIEFFTSEFLMKEWSRVAELGLDAFKVLGDEPPWLST
jgi:hypothetical protein